MENEINIFIAYSHEDEHYKEEIVKHLSVLEKNEVINSWHDRKILPGKEWNKAINEKLESAEIILLLISSDFLFSDYAMIRK